MNIVSIVDLVVSDRVNLLTKISVENSHLKIFDAETYEIIYGIISIFKEFAKVCNSVYKMISLIVENSSNKEKQQTYILSSQVYLDTINCQISNMIYLVKKLSLTVKPKHLSEKASVLFDFSASFSYDNLKGFNTFDSITLDDFTRKSDMSNLIIMKNVYKYFTEYFENILTTNTFEEEF